MYPQPQRNSLFPTCNTLEQFVAEAKAQLPITHENQLMSLLQTHQNTILKLQDEFHAHVPGELSAH